MRKSLFLVGFFVGFFAISALFSQADAYDSVPLSTYESMTGAHSTVSGESLSVGTHWVNGTCWYGNRLDLDVVLTVSGVGTASAWGWFVGCVWWSDTFPFSSSIIQRGLWSGGTYEVLAYRANSSYYVNGQNNDPTYTVGGNVYYRFLMSPSTGAFLALSNTDFVSGNVLVRLNGSNFDYYQFSDSLSLTLLSSVAVPSGLTFPANWTPNHIYPRLDGKKTFFYVDSFYNPVFLNLFEDSGITYGIGSVSVLNRALGLLPTPPAADVAFFLTQSGSILPYYSSSGTTFVNMDEITGDEKPFAMLLSFSNPKAYFYTSSNTIYSYDINCVAPGYNSCVIDVNDSKYYCHNGSSYESPRRECSGAVAFVSPNSGGSGGSGSWSTGSGSSGGSPSSFSYAPVDQSCLPKSFSGSYSSVSTSETLDPASCAWRTLSGSFMCQDQYAHACVIDQDACLPQISDPSQYSSTGSVYDGDVTRYECSVTWTQCRWYSKNSCGPTSLCYRDGDYCRVRPEYVPQVVTEKPDPTSTGTVLPDSECSGFGCVASAIRDLGEKIMGKGVNDGVSGLGEVSFSGETSFGTGYDLSNLGAIGTGSVSVSFGSGGKAGSFSGVALIGDTASGFCDMFNPDGSFAYYSDAQPFAVTLSASGVIPLDWVQENVVPHVDRAFSYVTAPVNNLGAILNTVGTFPEGSKVCVLGSVAEVRYQASLKKLDDAKHIRGFTYGKMGFFDYLFLLVFGSAAVWLLVRSLRPN